MGVEGGAVNVIVVGNNDGKDEVEAYGYVTYCARASPSSGRAAGRDAGGASAGSSASYTLTAACSLLPSHRINGIAAGVIEMRISSYFSSTSSPISLASRPFIIPTVDLGCLKLDDAPF